jgi:hypothetical protein
MPLNLNWIKFKFIDIKRMPDMSKLQIVNWWKLLMRIQKLINYN